jgi:broad specificity phosphatase PhoE
MPNRRLLRTGTILILAVLVFAPLRARQSDSITTVIFVRHAEKDTVGVNPSLTKRGMERAEALGRVLARTSISTIYVTQFVRTQQTAQVVADRESLKPIVFDVDLSKPKQYAKALAEDILKKHAGETILVSNHSNMIPFIIDALGGGWIGNIDERVYDNLLILVRHSSGEMKLLQLKYGAPTD